MIKLTCCRAFYFVPLMPVMFEITMKVALVFEMLSCYGIGYINFQIVSKHDLLFLSMSTST